MTTPIEERVLWAIHRAAARAAKARGVCWWCCQLAGFAATDAHVNNPHKPEFCGKCRGRET
jgi:hypothetical protein